MTACSTIRGKTALMEMQAVSCVYSLTVSADSIKCVNELDDCCYLNSQLLKKNMQISESIRTQAC